MADGTYAVDGMYAVGTFGGYIKSTNLKHFVFNKVDGHFIAEAQIENDLPFGRTVTIYDDQFNKIDEIQLLARRMQLGTEGSKYGWHSVYRATSPSSQMFIHDDRWLFFVGGYSRWWAGSSHLHLGKSISVLDLENLDDLSYQSDNAYGVTHTYTNVSFIGGLDIPRWNFDGDNLETIIIDGKRKIINAGWIPTSNYVANREGEWAAKLWIHDVDDIISQALANPDGGDGLNIFEPEQEFDIFVGDGTKKEYTVETGFSSSPDYSVTLPQGIGPEGYVLSDDTLPSGIGGRWEYDLVPRVLVSGNQIVVTNSIKSEVYELSNGSLSLVTLLNKPIPVDAKLVINGELIGYQHEEKYYPDAINSSAHIRYEEGLGGGLSTPDIQYVEPFTLTEPQNYPMGYFPDPVTAIAQGEGREIRWAYENGNLSTWITQMVRALSVYIDYKDNGSYEVYTNSGEVLDSGRWLAPEVTASSGSFNEPKIEFISINGVQVTSWQDVHENEDYAPNLKISVIESDYAPMKVEVRETDLSVDSSIPVNVEIKFLTSISGLSRISSSEQEITINLTLDGRVLPSVDLTDPNVIIDVAPGALLEWPDDAMTDHALKVMKPHVPYENNAAGYVSETLFLDPSTESVEFYIQGDALNGQQLTFEFGDGWVDSYGGSLGTVIVDLHPSDLDNPNPRGDQFENITFDARIGAVTGGEDLSVTVSTFFDDWRQNEYDNSGISTTMTRIIPIQISNLAV